MILFAWPSVVEFMAFFEIIKDPFTTIGIQMKLPAASCGVFRRRRINSDEFVSHRIHFGFRFLSLKCEDRDKTQPYGLIDDK